jgi:hypothetical protein
MTCKMGDIADDVDSRMNIRWDERALACREDSARGGRGGVEAVDVVVVAGIAPAKKRHDIRCESGVNQV